MPQTTVQMSAPLMAKLVVIAEKLSCSKDRVIKDAVSQYISRIEKKETMLIETKQALAEIDAGDVVDGDEIIGGQSPIKLGKGVKLFVQWGKGSSRLFNRQRFKRLSIEQDT
jgi:predicted transcriptional regulator